ncbi:MAG: helix-turn-helix domain-containing protein [bacterium]|nr:helix-turn-helix domain-containing protein [bacterium]
MATRPTTTAPVAGRSDLMHCRLAWNVDEAAALIGISRRHPYELLGSGELRSIKIGSRRLVRQSDLEQFIDGVETVV